MASPFAAASAATDIVPADLNRPEVVGGAGLIARNGSPGFVVTEPGTLLLLGMALVSVGAWTRRLLVHQKRDL